MTPAELDSLVTGLLIIAGVALLLCVVWLVDRLGP